MEILKKVKRSLKGRGLWNSIMLIPKRYVHRYKHRKLDFWGLVETYEMDGPVEVREHATKYEASNPVFFKKMFNNLDWQYQESTYIDFGCGKGISLVYAYELGFKKVIGVEFSPMLAQTAITNMQKFSFQKGGKIDFEIANIDASQYEIPTNADCFYFYNPFDAFILEKVMNNILLSLETNPRKILIVYINAIHNEVIEKFNFKKIRYLAPKELDIYYHGGAYAYSNI